MRSELVVKTTKMSVEGEGRQLGELSSATVESQMNISCPKPSRHSQFYVGRYQKHYQRSMIEMVTLCDSCGAVAT